MILIAAFRSLQFQETSVCIWRRASRFQLGGVWASRSQVHQWPQQWLPSSLSEICKGPDEPLLDLDYVVWCLQVVLRWAHPFLSMFFSIYFSELIWRAVKFRSRVSWSIGLSLPIACVVGCTWMCMEFMVVFTDDNSGLPVLPFLFMCALLVCASSRI